MAVVMAFSLLAGLAPFYAVVALVAVGTVLGSYRRKPSFRERYRQAVAPWNPSWQATRRLTFALAWGRDCVFPWLRANQADHLHYKNLGAEIPWLDVVPLHERTHALVTVLRRSGLRGPVNLMLRLGYGAWIAADVYAVLLVLSALHIVRGVPPPWDLLAHAWTLVQGLPGEVARGLRYAVHLAVFP